MSLFAAQASFVALGPILPAVARDFGVSTATAGQLRAVSALAGGVTALSLRRLARHFGTRDLLLVGLTLIIGASIASATAGAFAVLAAAQVAVGAGVAIVLTAGVAAAADWSPPGRRANVLAWALVGQPAAWVVGMPVIGSVSTLGWRLGWLAVPLPAALVALIAVAARRRDPAAAAPVAWRSLLGRGEIARWAAGELLAFAGWGGTLVFAGAVFVESYGLSPRTTGLLLGLAAVAYFPGTILARRHVEARARALLVALGTAAGGAVTAFGMLRPAAWFSLLVFAAAVAMAGGRAIAGSAFGLGAAPDQRVTVMAIRAAATQFGYLVGAGLGGLAVAAGGYGALGALLGTLFMGSALTHVAPGRTARARRSRRGEPVASRVRAVAASTAVDSPC